MTTSDIIASTAHVVDLNTNNKHKDKPYRIAGAEAER
jgi:hypothetical protein